MAEPFRVAYLLSSMPSLGAASSFNADVVAA
nr:MAG TPA: hypothetical protein [Caudoviricetes sp.]